MSFDTPRSVYKSIDDYPRLSRFLSFLNNNFELYLLISLYIYIILVVNIEIIRRFIFQSSTVWGHESARFMYIYLTWIGVSWGVHKRVHIRIDIAHQFISERLKGVLYILSGLGLLALSIYAINWSIPVLQTAIQYGSTTPGMRVGRTYFLVAIPIAFSLTIIRTLQWLYKDIKNVYYDRPVDTGEPLFRRSD